MTIKPAVVSAGFVIQAPSGKVLIVRPSGKTGSTGGWGFPKGKRDPGETILNAANREVVEETGINVFESEHTRMYNETPFFHYTVETSDQSSKKKYNKHVYAFMAYGLESVETVKCVCTTMLDCGRPEVDQFEWVTLEEAYEKVVKSQKGLFKFLLDYKNHNEENVKS